MQYGFGIDVGGTTVKIAFFDRSGDLLEKWEIPTRAEENGRYILPDIAESVGEYLQKQQLSSPQVLGIGIGVPGPVEAGGIINRCVNLGWGRFDLCGELERLTGLPVVAGNDASLAALGECWRGGGQGCCNMALVTLGTGVGGGIVAGGKILYGAHGAGGEIGHMTVDPLETEVCACGKRGCAEQYCSATGIVRLTKKHLAEVTFPSVLRGREFSCKDVFDAAAGGDALATEVLERVYGYLGMVIANVCCVADPEVVVLGGGVSRAGQPLLDGARRYFGKYCFHACRDTRFALATLGNDAGVHGAFKLLIG
ncbi:MAG: ROK family glucokinase [Oscillospiraceae bacterium]|nr:ROK family glucokinase [Oscillospiraceae bacterium]